MGLPRLTGFEDRLGHQALPLRQERTERPGYRCRSKADAEPDMRETTGLRGSASDTLKQPASAADLGRVMWRVLAIGAVAFAALSFFHYYGRLHAANHGSNIATAEDLERFLNSSSVLHYRCQPGFSGWDYVCSFMPLDGSRVQAGFLVKSGHVSKQSPAVALDGQIPLAY